MSDDLIKSMASTFTLPGQTTIFDGPCVICGEPSNPAATDNSPAPLCDECAAPRFQKCSFCDRALARSRRVPDAPQICAECMLAGRDFPDEDNEE